MGDEEKKDPPPPSLSKSGTTPPPPSLSKPEPAPSSPPMAGGSGPRVVQQAPIKVDSQDAEEDDDLTHGNRAPLNPRLLAAFIDALVAAGLYLVVVMILPDFLSKLAWVIQAAYWVTRDSLPFLNGQSIGKTAMKLKVEKNDGSSMLKDWQTAIIRNVPLIIPFFGLIEAIVLMSRESKPERGLRLGDEWAKTKVVVWRPEEGSEEEGQTEEEKPA